MSASRLLLALSAGLLLAGPAAASAPAAGGSAAGVSNAGAALADAALADSGPADAGLATMVETERAFAALAVETTMREAFITYVAEDGVGFESGPIPLRRAMRDRPAGPEPFKLIWEPRYGDIAASGEVGYLTGPYRVEGRGNDGAPFVRQGCFFSVWRRQPDGEFRNVLDIGVRTPEAAAFAPGFRRAPHAGRFAGPAAGEAEASLRAADRALNEAARTGTLREALAAVLDPKARLHRDGVAPAADPAAARRLLEGAGKLSEATSEFAGSAASGDLGWTYGRYARAAPAAPERGSYARVWTRDRAGTWRVVADIAAADREAR